jgi:zinc/manganese transport system ATP-binding protein
LSFGDKKLWEHLNLEIAPGEFIAVLGTNGSGKTTLLKAILGQQKIDSGRIEISGKPIGHGSRNIGYIPQHRNVDAGTPLLAQDLLSLGLTGHRFGFRLSGQKIASESTTFWVASMASTWLKSRLANFRVASSSGSAWAKRSSMNRT